MKTRSHDDFMAEKFRKDPTYAQELLNEILAEGAMDEAMIVLCQMSKAFSGVDAAATQADLNDRTLRESMRSTNMLK